MLKVILRRLLIAVPMLLIISTITFFLVAFIPGDPAVSLLGPEATAAEYDALREQLGLNKPLFEQYLTWISGLVVGDFGESIRSGTPVIASIADRLPVTMSLALLSILVTMVVGVGLGLVAALNQGVPGKTAQVVSVIGAALPNFWVGVMLVLVFSVTLRWLPANGYVPPGQSVGLWLQSMALPVAAVSLIGIAAVARQTRGSVTDVINQSYIRNLLALGTPRGEIVMKHVLRNAAIPVTTTLSFQFILVLSGAIVVERVFSLPGLGQLMISAISTRDAPTAQGIVVITAALVLLVTLAVDILNAWLDPKVRHAK
jgi:peptide/nickel transport system permease protein